MIVKDESSVIQECLASVKPLIDHWIIQDTGSSDGTQKIIREFLHDIPGKLWEQPWVNFAYNRNIALQLAKNKGDYLLFLDADEKLIYPPSFVWPKLDRDCFIAKGRYLNRDDIEFCRTLLIDNRLDWEWSGIIHEEIHGTKSQKREGHFLNQLYILTDLGGCRSKNPNKTLQDAKILEEALLTDPHNARYQFYLALSYDVAKEHSKAFQNYEKRCHLAEDEGEIFYSLYRMARLQEQLKAPKDQIIASYLRAYQFRPTRAEPLYYLAKFHIEWKDFHSAYDIVQKALLIPQPNDLTFVEPPVYEYELLWLEAECSFQLKKYQETHGIFRKLLSISSLPPDRRQQIEKLLPFFVKF